MNMKANAIINKGTKKTQKGRNRKHYSQMIEEEIIFLTNWANMIQQVSICEHAKEKLEQINIDIKFLNKLLGNISSFNIIEYNTGKGNEQRVVIKDYRTVNTKEGLKVNACYVIELNSRTLVTTWVNEIGDDHNTLDLNNYNADLKIIS